MKTQPDYVAYTCARCGAIGVVIGGEPLSELRTWAAAPASPGEADHGCRGVAFAGRRPRVLSAQ